MSNGRRPVIWSSRALTDLDEIWYHYVQVAGRTVAEKIVRNIGNVIALIEDYPLAGRSRSEIRPGLRSIAASPYVVFYRITKDVPEIVRVLDGRQDIDEIFAGHDQ
jgi:toxin ParE1/3/4